MVTSKSKLNNKGFSLIELMVVVAIIGILAAIGIPQYSKFQAKARQSEAKATLNALYTAQASFFLEWNNYTSDLKSMGMGVSGTLLRYTAGWNTSACSPALPAPPEAAAAANSQVHLATVNQGVNAATFAADIPNGTTVTTLLAGSACSNTAGAQTFMAAAVGDPRSNPAAISATSDTWTINNGKSLSNTITGL